MKIMSIIMIFLIILACSFEKKEASIDTVLTNAISTRNELYQDSVQTKLLISDDDFVFSVLDYDLNYDSIDSAFLKKDEFIVKNMHDNTINDTIVMFSRDSDSFKYYKGFDKKILMEAEIQSIDFKIANDELYIGVEYNAFMNKFNVETFVDTLIVKDFENSNYFIFLFDSDERLDRIIYKTRYLD